MDAQALLSGLENHTLPAEQFNHLAHLQAAWAYRQRFAAREAAARCAYSLSRYAMAKGAIQKYHHTLTMALLTIMYDRIAHHPEQLDDWDAFAAANADMLANARALVAEYYSEQKLQEDEARSVFIAPDLAALPVSCLTH